MSSSRPTPRLPPDPDQVVSEVLASRRYGDIDPGLVRSVCRMETPKERRLQEAVKRVKRKLHQMVGAYLDQDLPYDRWTRDLAAAPAEKHPELCRSMLEHHASTRERLPELTGIFRAAFEGIPTPTCVADLACGLNPLARSFMPLPATTLYQAFDVHLPLLRFLNTALATLGTPVEARAWNLLEAPPPTGAEIVLLLKTLPCLEQADPGSTRRLLEQLEAPLIVVTFPTLSLGGNRRGMAAFYHDRFLAALPPQRYRVETREFRTELLFRLHRLPESTPAPAPDRIPHAPTS